MRVHIGIKVWREKEKKNQIEMDKKREDSGKKLYFTSENGECSSFSIVSGAEKLDEYSRTRTLPQVNSFQFSWDFFPFFSFFV